MGKVSSFRAEQVKLTCDEPTVRNLSERWVVQFVGAPGLDFATMGEIFREGTFKEDVVLDLNKEIGRYVRIIAKGAGECPATHVRPGQEARIYFDEVMIE